LDAQRIAELERENAELRRAHEILKSASASFARDSTRARPGERLHRGPQGALRGRADLPHARDRPLDLLRRPSPPDSGRALADRELVHQIHAARSGYRAVYGARKTWRELQRRRVAVGRDRVARLMRTEGLQGIRRGRAHRTTTPAETAARSSP
jgi:HTH-like domain